MLRLLLKCYILNYKGEFYIMVKNVLYDGIPEQDRFPQLWIDGLKKIQETRPEAFIAGGCLRDWSNGKADSFKDVDIFVNSKADILSRIARGITEQSSEYSEASRPIEHVYTTDCGLGCDAIFNIIELKKPMTIEEVLLTFDYHINQWAFDGTHLYMTDKTLADNENQTFTMIDHGNWTRNYLNRTLMRWNRFKKKYSDYSLVIPASVPLGIGVLEDLDNIDITF